MAKRQQSRTSQNETCIKNNDDDNAGKTTPEGKLERGRVSSAAGFI